MCEKESERERYSGREREQESDIRTEDSEIVRSNNWHQIIHIVEDGKVGRRGRDTETERERV